MRLYFHPESDGLYWDEFVSDPFVEDVTDEPRFRHAAKLRGLKEPAEISVIVEPEKLKPIVPKARSVANAIIQSYKTWERKPADVYPTPVDGTESIIPLIEAMSAQFEAIHGRPIRRIWEPACGDGRLARVLEWHGYEVVSTDLREFSGYGQGGIDFLHGDPATDYGWDIGEIDMIVTNPPFNLSVEFVRRALAYTPFVIMLVKQNYYNTQNRYGFFQDARPNLFLPLTWRLAFLEEERGKSPLMDCAWAVWSPAMDQSLCAFEPVLRRKYPGYHRKGLAASVQIAEGEMSDLVQTLKNEDVIAWLASLKES